METTEQKNNLMTPIAIIIAGLLIAGAVFYRDSTPAPTPTNSDEPAFTSEAVRPINPETDHVRGNIQAPITIVEYSDLECPFCKVFHQSMTKVFEKYNQNNQIAWVYRHFPLDGLHKQARPEAIATECAAFLGGNEKFWGMHDKIFNTTTSNDGLDMALLPTFATELGLDQGAFNTCLKNKTMADKVEADYQNGLDVGVTGTPFAVMINNATGEKIVLLKDNVPESWGENAKNIEADILENWENILKELRGEG